MTGSSNGSRYRVTIRGTVQGVGFRPFVYNLACSLGIKGFVTNTSAGVVIEAEGKNASLFIEKIKTEAPPLSDIASIDVTIIPPARFKSFEIKKSESTGTELTFIPPDTALCENCRTELYDPSDRHYHYPFTNCTNCGPRYSITKTIPYDRKNTTMAAFRMCADCEREYHDPRDRRFHAQPNACPRCGPELKLIIQNSIFKINKEEKQIETTIRLLKMGAVVAVKGIGGFHIACDAKNNDVVRKLRDRKKRKGKPFAIMCPDIETATRFGQLDEVSKALLLSPESPALLLRKKDNAGLAESVAPDNPYVGIMLPYSPLHHLLFFYPGGKRPNFDALVMTSGNISEEPIIRDNDEALQKLGSVCDAFLIHNRDIQTRVDDSVVNVITGKPSVIRRSRGYAPHPLRLPFAVPPLLACGAELKSTFTLAKDGAAIVSQHLGDMDNYETLNLFEETLSNLKVVFNIEPEFVFYDLHPDYGITKWAKQTQKKGFAIQHHEAHIASCMAENGVEGAAIGVALDGTGYGRDGNIWGGEIFAGSLDGFSRKAHFRYVPMPGGEMAIKHPWRMAVSALMSSSKDNIAYIMERWGKLGADAVLNIMEKGINSPLTSSCGRLFDAAASVIGGFDHASFEAEAAIGLESLAVNRLQGTCAYDIISENGMVIIDVVNALSEIIEDVKKKGDKQRAASLFHNTIVAAVADAVTKIASSEELNMVCLSGGAFQNKIFTEMLLGRLAEAGLKVFTHKKVPTNDGGISFGQAALGGWRVKCA